MKIHRGDALAVLKKMPDQSVQCIVTSPPYWGLRDYGTAKWKGGDPNCDHKPRRDHAGEKQATQAGSSRDPISADCPKHCGATRVDQQIGLERTPEEYVAKLVAVFREARRVLRDDGTLWLNLGDSYATGAGKVGDCPGGGKQGDRFRGANPTNLKRGTTIGPASQPNRMPIRGLKPKDLVGIPWRVAFALQADGWYLRSDIIWHKPNPMPESVTDRPTKAHEYLFLLAKSSRYYYNADAVREPYVQDHAGIVLGRGMQPYSRERGNDRSNSGGYPQTCSGRNRRTVWSVTSRPFKDAHFATFPLKLIEPCILAGAPVGGTVLDCFAGAGTTALACKMHGREFVGIELNPDYVTMATKRLAAAA